MFIYRLCIIRWPWAFIGMGKGALAPPWRGALAPRLPEGWKIERQPPWTAALGVAIKLLTLIVAAMF